VSSSSDFIYQARRLGLETVADILEADIGQLKKRKGFSYLWYADLLNLLKKEHLFDVFQARLF
jgi:hypothetical protein